MREKNELIFYTIEVNQNSTVLAHTVLWIRKFAHQFDKVRVVCIHMNTNSLQLPANVTIDAISGGSFNKKILAVFRLYLIFLRDINLSRKQIVLYHMSPYPMLFLGILYRILGIPQFLWYSHAKAPKFLAWNVKFLHGVFSPTYETFPVKSNKVTPLCHGIPVREKMFQSDLRKFGSIVVLGRVAPIKHIEELLFAIKSMERLDLEIVLIGESVDDKYLSSLKSIAKTFRIQFEVREAIDHNLIAREASRFSIVFSGTRDSVDKAPLECALSGCFIVGNSKALLKCSGMSQLVRETFSVDYSRLNIANQIEFILGIQNRVDLRSRLAQLCQYNNDLENLVRNSSLKMLSAVSAE